MPKFGNLQCLMFGISRSTQHKDIYRHALVMPFKIITSYEITHNILNMTQYHTKTKRLTIN